jgi:hypothetical protein
MRGLEQSRSVPTTVFRRMERILRADDTLQRCVDTWKTYGPLDRDSPTPSNRTLTEIRLFPRISQQQPESPDSHTVMLSVECVMVFPTTDAGDYLDLWQAVQRALYPKTQAERLALAQSLRDDGATTGECRFGVPGRVDSQTLASGQMAVMGPIIIECRWLLNG